MLTHPRTHLTTAPALAARRGAKLIDSFCVVSTPRASPGAGAHRFADALGQPPSSPVVSRCPSSSLGGGAFVSAAGTASVCGGSVGAASAAAGGSVELDGASSEMRTRMVGLTAERDRLHRENVSLRQTSSEMLAVFVKARSRAADQQRLARKALSALREVHGVPRPELPADAAREIADLRSQLERAHAARRQQAELVRKYEQRWAQLKASARRKQAALGKVHE